MNTTYKTENPPNSPFRGPGGEVIVDRRASL